MRGAEFVVGFETANFKSGHACVGMNAMFCPGEMGLKR